MKFGMQVKLAQRMHKVSVFSSSPYIAPVVKQVFAFEQ